MQAPKSDEQAPVLRSVRISELKADADEIVREVHETGRSIDIIVRGKVVARLGPSPVGEIPIAEDRRQAARDWLRMMDEVSRAVGAVWPRGVSEHLDQLS